VHSLLVSVTDSTLFFIFVSFNLFTIRFLFILGISKPIYIAKKTSSINSMKKNMSTPEKETKIASCLDQLKEVTIVVADSGDFQCKLFSFLRKLGAIAESVSKLSLTSD
jgi:hypothetical protein